jgi:hypothetical protein
MLTITGFVAHHDRLCAKARFIGYGVHTTNRVCTGAEGVLLPVKVRKSSADLLSLEIGPLPLLLLDAHAALGRATLNITAYSDPTGARRALLEAISHILSDPTIALERQAQYLNDLLSALAWDVSPPI